MSTWLVVANLAISGLLAGLVWTVQVVHSRWFAQVPPERCVAYHEGHWIRTLAWTARVVLLARLAATRS